jgi:hypothetical protein
MFKELTMNVVIYATDPTIEEISDLVIDDYMKNPQRIGHFGGAAYSNDQGIYNRNYINIIVKEVDIHKLPLLLGYMKDLGYSCVIFDPTQDSP